MRCSSPRAAKPTPGLHPGLQKASRAWPAPTISTSCEACASTQDLRIRSTLRVGVDNRGHGTGRPRRAYRRRAVLSRWSALLLQPDIQRLDLLPRPGGLAQESQAGLDARVALEAADIDARRQAVPAQFRHQVVEDGFQGDAMQRVFRRLSHAEPVSTAWRGAPVDRLGAREWTHSDLTPRPAPAQKRRLARW